jgi:nicotinate phosphoribosyltransferase
MIDATRIDLYQLTSLVTHHEAGRSDDRVVMTFFSRNLPRNPHTGEFARGYIVWAGLAHALDYLERARFSEASIEALVAHGFLGPALAAVPELVQKLRNWSFHGTVHAPPEGTPIFAGPALRSDGSRLESHGVKPAAYTPYLIVETDLLSAKLIETPLLSIINHLSMVATKAAHVVDAAGTRPVIEFGTRRTNMEAAVDAAYAAYIGGCAATSNVEAHRRFGIPMTGTMDHFAVQCWEQPDQPRHATEQAFFAAFHARFAGHDTLLVDTYDAFGERTGIRAAVAATGGRGPHAIRIDSGVTRENVLRARALLDGLGATSTQIFVSGGMDEAAIRGLGNAPVDGFGVGENLVVSADAPVGVGAVGKLTMVRGRPTTKLARGSGKAHLPGIVQVWRDGDRDIVGLNHETDLPGTPLLHPVWTPETGRLPLPETAEVRARARTSLLALSESRKAPAEKPMYVSDRLAHALDALAAHP